ANELGNLLSRTVSMIGKYRAGRIPSLPTGRSAADSPLAAEASQTAVGARVQLEDMDLSGALETIWTLVRRLNRYVEEQAPWNLAKDQTPAGQAALDATLWDLAEGLRLLSVLLYPFMPVTAAAIRSRLGLPIPTGEEMPAPSWREAEWGLLPSGLTVIAAGSLFPRIEE
ncbi:MAG: methionine--tRNA ligase, partial [Thermoleophilia bacterium]|nr:methionine--tRNA ligase [Thermoleophilia bacterium]